MKILYVYNQHRGGGGANAAFEATIALSRNHGLDVDVFTRSSNRLRSGLIGRAIEGVNAFYQRESLHEFQAALDSFKPDVVHVADLFPMISPWILPLCTKQRIPVVMAFCDYRLTCPITTHYRNGAVCTRCITGKEYLPLVLNCRCNVAESAVMALYRLMVRKFRIFTGHVTHFVTPSDFSRQWLIDNAGIHPDRVTTIALSVELAESAADPAAGNYVGFAGRFVPEKGIDTLLQAARMAKVPVRLSRNDRMLVKFDVPAEAEVVVTRNRAELDAFYRGARIMAVPSMWFETFGLVAAEAMSHGIPVIASRLGALGDMFEDGVAGMYFAAGNARDLAGKINLLWNDTELCRRLGTAGRERIGQLCDPRQHFNRHLAVYEKVVRRRRAPEEMTPASL